MLKKSKVIAVLSVCVMMFGVVQPAFARSADEVANDASYGAGIGCTAGMIIGGIIGFCIGGPAGAWAGAETGTLIGGATGMVAGATIDTGRTTGERKAWSEQLKKLETAHDALEAVHDAYEFSQQFAK